MASVGWRAGDPRKKLSQVKWQLGSSGLGVGWGWASPTSPVWGLTGLKGGQDGSFPPLRAGSRAEREACRTLGLAPCSMFCPGGSLLLAAGDYFSGHTKTGDLNDWKRVGGVVWLLRAPRKYLLFSGLLAPPKVGARGEEEPTYLFWSSRGSRNGWTQLGPKGSHPGLTRAGFTSSREGQPGCPGASSVSPEGQMPCRWAGLYSTL